MSAQSVPLFGVSQPSHRRAPQDTKPIMFHSYRVAFSLTRWIMPLCTRSQHAAAVVQTVSHRSVSFATSRVPKHLLKLVQSRVPMPIGFVGTSLGQTQFPAVEFRSGPNVPFLAPYPARAKGLRGSLSGEEAVKAVMAIDGDTGAAGRWHERSRPRRGGREEGGRGWLSAGGTLGAAASGNGEPETLQEKFWMGLLTLMQAQYMARPKHSTAKRMTSAHEA